MLATAVGALKDFDETGRLSMAVNISAGSLLRPGFAHEILGTLVDAGADPAQIVLEITETSLLTDPVRAKEACDG